MEVERAGTRREEDLNQSRLVALLSKSPLSSYNSHERFYRRRWADEEPLILLL